MDSNAGCRSSSLVPISSLVHDSWMFSPRELPEDASLLIAYLMTMKILILNPHLGSQVKVDHHLLYPANTSWYLRRWSQRKLQGRRGSFLQCAASKASAIAPKRGDVPKGFARAKPLLDDIRDMERRLLRAQSSA